ncbi:MAG: Fe-S oxidoreductase-like protein in Rubrerythrin cluster [Nitrospira sp.]|jgi:glycerol-3-phosphate dehydrogenase subunit C|nr:Fe-S oxidoreductase-like protein in Rubrerythrin cluster [Nitrospira sp.]
MKGFDLADDRIDRPAVEKDTLRIFDICDGCRRCINLCPSFNTLLDRLDVVDSDVHKLTAVDTRRIVDECYYCKLCFNHCPYTPPHQFDLDFPRLMVTWKRLYAEERTPPLRDRLLIRTDLIGRVGTLFAPFVNWANRQPFFRRVMEAVLGIHRERRLLSFQSGTFPRWWARSRAAGAPSRSKSGLRVALFSTCTVNYHCTEIGRATVQVLEKNGVEVIFPEGQQCCGMPCFDVGDIATMKRKAEANLGALEPWVRQGYDVIAPVPSCSLMLKREYPDLLKTELARLVGERTFDICEYLMKLKRQGHLNMDFVRRPLKIAYQIPCHLRDQNIGFKSKELMELTGATVEVIERCAGHDGTWGVKAEFFDLSMKIARKVVSQVKEAQPDLVASDCPLAALQIDQASQAIRPTLHPIQIVKQAYGL